MTEPNKTSELGQNLTSTEYYKRDFIRILCAVFIAPFGLLSVFIGVGDAEVIFAICGSILILFTIYIWFRDLTFRLYVNEQMIIKKNIFGECVIKIDGKIKFYHRNIQEELYDIPINKYAYITIKNETNCIKVNNGLKDIDELQDRLLYYEKEFIFPRLFSMYQSGIPLDFGPFRIHHDQLQYKNKFASLKELYGPLVYDGELKFKYSNPKKSFCVVSISKIPNFLSFLRLIDPERFITGEAE